MMRKINKNGEEINLRNFSSVSVGEGKTKSDTEVQPDSLETELFAISWFSFMKCSVN